MYKLILVLLTFVALIGSVVAQTNEWQRLAPTGAGYAVMIPGKAEEQSINKEQYSASLYILTVKDASTPRVIYLAGIGDYAATMKVDPQIELPADRDTERDVRVLLVGRHVPDEASRSAVSSSSRCCRSCRPSSSTTSSPTTRVRSRRG